MSIVVPTFNERQNLPRLIALIEEHVRVPHEIIIVDDASPDGTADLARDLATRTRSIRLVRRPAKMGLGSAYRDGFREARGSIIFEMDADLSHDPRHMRALIDAVSEGRSDIAIGSRYVEGGRIVGWGAYRRLVSGVGNMIARTVLGLGARDVTSGYRCYVREAADIVQAARSDGYAFQVEALFLARRGGMRIVEVPITFENRTVGKSKLRPGEFAHFLATIARLRVNPPKLVRRAPARS